MNTTHQKKVIFGIGLFTTIALSSFVFFKDSSVRNLGDEALLSIIKNDQKGFEGFISGGGLLSTQLQVEGQSLSVGELIIRHERVGFIKYALDKKLDFGIDSKNIYSLAVKKNNVEVLELLMRDKKDLDKNLMHLASTECASKVIPVLHQAGLSWNKQSEDGMTPLTLAAKAGCLEALSYWKQNGADFRARDGRGMTALHFLNSNKDAAISAFAESFATKRVVASVSSSKEEPNFYKKRQIPKDNLADRAHLIEPEARPDDANETAEYSEFSD